MEICEVRKYVDTTYVLYMLILTNCPQGTEATVHMDKEGLVDRCEFHSLLVLKWHKLLPSGTSKAVNCLFIRRTNRFINYAHFSAL